MWKRIDQSISVSEKLSGLSHVAFRVWVHILPWTDCKGRYSANPNLLKSQCLPLVEIEAFHMDAALEDLERAGLLHTYENEHKKCLVLHDYENWNPTKGLKYQKPKWPAPKGVSCECVNKECNDVGNGVDNADSLSLSLSSLKRESKPVDARGEIVRQLMQKLQARDCPNSLETQRKWVRSWIAKKPANEVDQVLSSNQVQGWDVTEINNAFFKKGGRGSVMEPEEKAPRKVYYDKGPKK